MSDNANFNKLSTYVGGIVDRKIKAISMAITGSGSYLRTLTLQTQGYANTTLGYVNTAAGHASDAASAAASSLIVYNDFTSRYLGVSASDPLVSQLGNPVLPGAFYIRSSDNRLRVCRSVSGDGTPSYVDATVQADLSSLSGAGAGVFLSLLTTTSQTVLGPVTFQNTVLVPRVTSWTSQQPATAVDVNDRVTALQGNITTEVNRATAAENAISTSRVAKIGDTMTGALVVAAASDAASVTVRNTTPGTGRQFRINSTNDGRFRIVDDTSTTERFAITSAGVAAISGSLTVTGGASAVSVAANNVPATDPSFLLQTSGVTRWALARSASSSRFYIARMNSSGVFIDTPISVNETDGSVTLNKVNLNDGINVKGDIRNDSVAAALILNNTTGTNDTRIQFSHLGAVRWQAGRSGSTGTFTIARFNNTGAFVDNPLVISDINGQITVNSLIATTELRTAAFTASGIIYSEPNGTGRNIQIGNDAWIGDINVGNTLGIRGVTDFNQGYIRFGNSGVSLGCNGDSVLKYGTDTVYHSGNLTADVLGFSYGTTGGVDWSKRPAGSGKVYVKMSGYMTFNQQRVAQVVTYPFPLEKIMDYQVSNVIPGDTVDRDQLAQFVNAPTLTQVRVVMQETAGQSGYPIGVRWTVEGIQA